jgi:hypothetical protein
MRSFKSALLSLWKSPVGMSVRIRAAVRALVQGPLAVALYDIPLSTWLWSDLETRRRIQKRGINVVPANFYSEVPTIEELDRSFEYQGRDNPPYPLDVDEQALRREIESLMPFADEFSPPATADGLADGERYSWDRKLFTYCDAMAYYCYVRKLKPRTILEFGSGYSTLVAIEAAKANGGGKIICVEPFPREFLKHKPEIELKVQPAQSVSAEYLNDTLQDGDILFIDSTHTVKAGSDCLHLYLRLLPKLRHDVTVHVHDIFLPFALPKAFMLKNQIYWTEQYLLLAAIQDNPKVRILFPNQHDQWKHPDLLKKLMAGKHEVGGRSFWFEYRGASTRS